MLEKIGITTWYALCGLVAWTALVVAPTGLAALTASGLTGAFSVSLAAAALLFFVIGSGYVVDWTVTTILDRLLGLDLRSREHPTNVGAI